MQFILEFQDSLKHVTHQHIELMILNESFFFVFGWLVWSFGYSDIVTKRGRCNCYIEYLVIHLIGLHNNFILGIRSMNLSFGHYHQTSIWIFFSLLFLVFSFI